MDGRDRAYTVDAMKTWVKLAVLAVAAVVATQLLVRPGGPAGGKESGVAAPKLVLPGLDGHPIDLASFRGKVVAVNFWATWCGPCRMEMPELAEVWTENRDRCFELLGVAEESGREDVLRTAPSIPYPILLDERAEALEPWGVQGYPITVLVDPEGRVRQTFRGALSKRRLESAIRPLLPATCPAKS
jgi:cytochrome c biogenesis protein CcmG/thiol:disulfide interchange protein DsbE